MNYKIKVIAILLTFSPLAVSAQKITLGSCTTRDGGSYKGEMVPRQDALAARRRY